MYRMMLATKLFTDRSAATYCALALNPSLDRQDDGRFVFLALSDVTSRLSPVATSHVVQLCHRHRHHSRWDGRCWGDGGDRWPGCGLIRSASLSHGRGGGGRLASELSIDTREGRLACSISPPPLLCLSSSGPPLSRLQGISHTPVVTVPNSRRSCSRTSATAKAPRLAN